MRMIKRNEIPMRYSLLHDIVPTYQTDASGNIIYDNVDGELVPRDTGKTRARYEAPVPFTANVNFTGQSEIRYAVYGLSKGKYDATLYVEKGKLPLTETSIIFIEAEPEYSEDGYVKLESADYRVVRTVDSLNYTTYLLRCAERTENNENP